MCAMMKYVSCCCASEAACECMTPLMPPIVKVTMNPSANSMGVGKLIDPFHIVPSQFEYLNSCRNRDGHRRDREDGVGDGPKSDREHVMAPHHPSHESDDDAGQHDHGVAEQRLAREGSAGSPR